ncbi:MAG: type IV secretion system DNA-binding domain-containing protein [Candidatus Thiodiazotropha sp. (ex Lucinoma borealis)]|nr:type IV secretion system DNA-binding domain-containing protein [Candidatus Thiodiazotropha sp. (ex Lucinoma borealis)]
MHDPSIAYFARTNFRNQGTRFGIKQTDRLSHIYTIGKTGTGKTSLLETLITSDIAHGNGLALIDPHGDLVERIAERIPPDRQHSLVYFNVPDPTQPYGYNPLKRVIPERRPLAASGILEVFKKMWKESWGQRLEHILRNALLALLETPEVTLNDILRLLDDKDFRGRVARNLSNTRVKEFWLKEFANYSYRLRAEAIVPIQNKVGAFLADPTLNRVLTNPRKPIPIRRIMDSGRILLVNLAKGRIGEDASGLLGGFLVTTIGLAAFSRADTLEMNRRDFYVYIDEFQNFTTLAIANMASELRKYHIGLTLANQYLHQLDPPIRYAVLGNAGTLISFRLGADDAPHIAREFAPIFLATDLMNLPNHVIYLKLMIDGTPSQPFSATTLPPKP